MKNRKRLEVVNKVLYRNHFDNTGRVLLKQIVVPLETTMPIIRTMHGDPMQGHPGASKLLAELRKGITSQTLRKKYRNWDTTVMTVVELRKR